MSKIDRTSFRKKYKRHLISQSKGKEEHTQPIPKMEQEWLNSASIGPVKVCLGSMSPANHSASTVRLARRHGGRARSHTACAVRHSGIYLQRAVCTIATGDGKWPVCR